MHILDRWDQVLRRMTWKHRGVEKAMWEREDTMQTTYPFLFKDEGAWSNIWH